MTLHELPHVLAKGMAVFLFFIAVGLVVMHTLLIALASQRSSLDRSKGLTVTGLVAVFLISWLSVVITFGDRTNFPFERETLRLPLSLLVGFGPMFLGIAALFALGALRRVNAAMPTTWLIWAQLYRVAGFIFLYPYLYYCIVPASFAIPAAIGDFLTGATTPLVALAVARRRPRAVMWATAWNLFGILDLTDMCPVCTFGEADAFEAFL